MNGVKDILSLIGITTASSIIITIILSVFGKALMQTLLNQYLELKKVQLGKDLEQYKQELNIKTEIQKVEMSKILESFKGELNLLNSKNIKLHEKQLSVIAELYKKLVKTHFEFTTMTAMLKPVLKDIEVEERERINEAGKAFNEYTQFYMENKVFFSKDTATLLDKLRDTWRNSFYDYSQKWGDHQTDYENTKRASEVVRNEIPKVLEKLEDEFRTLLTVVIN